MDRANILIKSVWRDYRSIQTSPKATHVHINEALKWLFASQDATDTGGSAACYNLFLGWGNPYPETTGYIIPTLYDVSNSFSELEAGKRAEQMAEWLLRIQFPNGAFPAGTYSDENQNPSVFNTGQILRGLVRAYSETKDERYKESAIAAIKWLIDVQNETGCWDSYDYNSLSHAYSSRISWPILEASDKFGCEIGRDAATANLQWVLDQQTEDGWFKKCAFTREELPYLHTIAYTIRGLLESTEYVKGTLSKQCYQAAVITADRLLEEQNRNGVLLGVYDKNWDAASDYYCLTGNAQMAIIWSRLYQLQNDRKYSNAAQTSVTFLKQHQTLWGPQTIRGGLRGSSPIWGEYMYFRYPNWACKFFTDALLIEDRLNIVQDE